MARQYSLSKETISTLYCDVGKIINVIFYILTHIFPKFSLFPLCISLISSLLLISNRNYLFRVKVKSCNSELVP